ncbi:MAG: helix-turn-helix domain-containing protein [Pseudonocardiales bacterium]
MTESFAEALRRFRRAGELSQEELAERAGLSASAIGALERGDRKKPYPHTVRTIADALGLTPAERQQLVGAAGRGVTKPTRADDVGGSVVPVPLTSFIGRQDLVGLCANLLRQDRLVTLIGMGGIGKSRLAVELVRSCADRFPDGRWIVDVESITQSESLGAAVAGALGLRDPSVGDHLDSLARSIGDLHCLLTLDGCEHLLQACATVARRLLVACPSLVVLVTSQHPLAVPGEVVVSVPPLALTGSDEAGVGESDAVQLFLARARLADPTLEPGEDQGRAIVDLCRRLDGIPLAIELAAARARVMPATELLSRMADRFTLLDAGPGHRPARKRAIRAALEWSCELLDAAERQLLGRLSVFVGGFTLTAVERGPGADLGDVLRSVADLVDRSLVVAERQRGPVGRFRLLETVRAYATELLDDSGDRAAVEAAHAQYYLDLAEEWEPRLRGPEQAEVLGWLDEDYENVRAALTFWSVNPDARPLLRLSTALAPYWVIRGRYRDGLRWLEHAIANNPPGRIPLRAFESASNLRWVQGDVSKHRVAAERYLENATETGDLMHQARALTYLSFTHRAEGDTATWRALIERARDLAEGAGDDWTQALVLNDSFSSVTNPTENDLSHLRDALALARRTGDVNLVSLVLDSLAYLEAMSGSARSAVAHWAECLIDLGTVVDPVTSASCIEGLARLALIDGRPKDCLALYAAAAAHRRRYDVTAPPMWREVIARTTAQASAALTTVTAEAACAAGQRLNLAEAIHVGLQRHDEPASH